MLYWQILRCKQLGGSALFVILPRKSPFLSHWFYCISLPSLRLLYSISVMKLKRGFHSSYTGMSACLTSLTLHLPWLVPTHRVTVITQWAHLVPWLWECTFFGFPLVLGTKPEVSWMVKRNVFKHSENGSENFTCSGNVTVLVVGMFSERFTMVHRKFSWKDLLMEIRSYLEVFEQLP